MVATYHRAITGIQSDGQPRRIRGYEEGSNDHVFGEGTPLRGVCRYSAVPTLVRDGGVGLSL